MMRRSKKFGLYVRSIAQRYTYLTPSPWSQDGDETAIYDAAQALIAFQKLYGVFPRIVGKGDSAAVRNTIFFFSDLLSFMNLVTKRLATLLTRHPPEESDPSPDRLLTPSGRIDSLIILDRKVDMITPLLTQLTYEGLIDEMLGIKNCMLHILS